MSKWFRQQKPDKSKTIKYDSTREFVEDNMPPAYDPRTGLTSKQAEKVAAGGEAEVVMKDFVIGLGGASTVLRNFSAAVNMGTQAIHYDIANKYGIGGTPAALMAQAQMPFGSGAAGQIMTFGSGLPIVGGFFKAQIDRAAAEQGLQQRIAVAQFWQQETAGSLAAAANRTVSLTQRAAESQIRIPPGQRHYEAVLAGIQGDPLYRKFEEYRESYKKSVSEYVELDILAKNAERADELSPSILGIGDVGPARRAAANVKKQEYEGAASWMYKNREAYALKHGEELQAKEDYREYLVKQFFGTGVAGAGGGYGSAAGGVRIAGAYPGPQTPEYLAYQKKMLSGTGAAGDPNKGAAALSEMATAATRAAEYLRSIRSGTNSPGARE